MTSPETSAKSQVYEECLLLNAYQLTWQNAPVNSAGPLHTIYLNSDPRVSSDFATPTPPGSRHFTSQTHGVRILHVLQTRGYIPLTRPRADLYFVSWCLSLGSEECATLKRRTEHPGWKMQSRWRPPFHLVCCFPALYFHQPSLPPPLRINLLQWFCR